ncbi:unnamed protein product, partial [Phaeothamnion confervicola]
AGALWYDVPVAVATGFETYFVFQITDHSRVCTTHRDPDFSLMQHKSCSVRGGDGLAFVLQRDPRGAAAVGGTGAQLGYGGIAESLAVEFDTWYNPPSGSNGQNTSSSPSSAASAENSTVKFPPRASSALTPPFPVGGGGLADGAQHAVKVAYYPRLALEY